MKPNEYERVKRLYEEYCLSPRDLLLVAIFLTGYPRRSIASAVEDYVSGRGSAAVAGRRAASLPLVPVLTL